LFAVTITFEPLDLGCFHNFAYCTYLCYYDNLLVRLNFVEEYRPIYRLRFSGNMYPPLFRIWVPMDWW